MPPRAAQVAEYYRVHHSDYPGEAWVGRQVQRRKSSVENGILLYSLEFEGGETRKVPKSFTSPLEDKDGPHSLTEAPPAEVQAKFNILLTT